MIICPNFFEIGAQKAGTTSIYDILSTHPEVFVCKKKENRFFNYHYGKGFEWYLKTYFNTTHNNNYLAIGEVKSHASHKIFQNWFELIKRILENPTGIYRKSKRSIEYLKKFHDPINYINKMTTLYESYV